MASRPFEARTRRIDDDAKLPSSERDLLAERTFLQSSDTELAASLTMNTTDTIDVREAIPARAWSAAFELPHNIRHLELKDGKSNYCCSEDFERGMRSQPRTLAPEPQASQHWKSEGALKIWEAFVAVLLPHGGLSTKRAAHCALHVILGAGSSTRCLNRHTHSS